jgi:hypothetical protein
LRPDIRLGAREMGATVTVLSVMMLACHRRDCEVAVTAGGDARLGQKLSAR